MHISLFVLCLHFKPHSPILKPHEASGSLTTFSFSLCFIPSLFILDFMLQLLPGGPFAFLLLYIFPSGTYFIIIQIIQ